MDPTNKGKEELQNSTASTTTSTETKAAQLDSPSASTPENKSTTEVKDDSSGDVGSTTVDTVQPPCSNSPNSETPAEPQGTKRVKELTAPTPNDPTSSDDSPKAKKVRKDDEPSVGDPDARPSVTLTLDKEKDGDSSEPGSGRSSADSALKVPPIKIVFQGHPNQTESMTNASQPHVITTTATTPFPYIVTTADSSGIPDSCTSAEKNDLPQKGPQDQSNERLESGKDRQREPVGGSDSPKSSIPMDTTEQKSNDGSSGSLTLDDRSAMDGTQSPSLLGKDKPTRVTRSSQRIATTIQASPTNSPKTSTCSSPTQMDGGNINGAEVLPGIVQESASALEASPVSAKTQDQPELHPRKRKLKGKDKEKEAKDKDKDKDKEKDKEVVKDPPLPPSSAVSSSSSTSGEGGEAPPSSQAPGSNNPHEPTFPTLNCVEMYLNIRKQIERRHQNLFPVQPKPPQGFKDYLMNRGTYVLSSTPNAHMAVPSNAIPPTLPPPLKELFLEQEKERHRLRLQQVVEKEKLVLSVEQEILRVHGRAARALSNQAVPFSVCTFLKDEEVYNLLTPEQEEKDRNVRSRYNGRLFLSWLQDVDDKWEKIKESMVLRHHNEAESLYAVQKMDWEWKMKEVGLCEPKATPLVDEFSVPMVFVSDDFDLLPA